MNLPRQHRINYAALDYAVACVTVLFLAVAFSVVVIRAAIAVVQS